MPRSYVTLLLPKRLLEVFEVDALDAGHELPEHGERLVDRLLPALCRRAHVEHDEANLATHTAARWFSATLTIHVHAHLSANCVNDHLNRDHLA